MPGRQRAETGHGIVDPMRVLAKRQTQSSLETWPSNQYGLRQMPHACSRRYFAFRIHCSLLVATERSAGLNELSTSKGLFEVDKEGVGKKS